VLSFGSRVFGFSLRRYQGTASAVPPDKIKRRGFSLCGFVCWKFPRAGFGRCRKNIRRSKEQGLKPEKTRISIGTAKSRALIPAEAKASYWLSLPP
jgi:hypothetical protein